MKYKTKQKEKKPKRKECDTIWRETGIRKYAAISVTNISMMIPDLCGWRQIKKQIKCVDIFWLDYFFPACTIPHTARKG